MLPGRPRAHALGAVFFALLATRCGSRVSPADGDVSSGIDAVDLVAPADVVDAHDATDTTPDTIDVGSMCFSDFPCFGRTWRCTDATHYQPYVDHDCHYACGPGPCSGGSCDPSGAPVTCAAGTVCVDAPPRPMPVPPGTMPCQARADAGTDASPTHDCMPACGASAFCLYPRAPGFCPMRPDAGFCPLGCPGCSPLPAPACNALPASCAGTPSCACLLSVCPGGCGSSAGMCYRNADGDWVIQCTSC